MEPGGGNHLPPLPASDPQSLRWNSKDNYYGVGARDYWGENEINRNEVEPFKSCQHYFELSGGEARCQKCHISFTGHLIEVRDGEIFLRGEAVKF